MNINIRRALPEDADILSKIAFSAKAHWDYSKHLMEMWKPQLTFSDDYFIEHESWTVELDGEPIAFYTLEERDRNAWMENLCHRFGESKSIWARWCNLFSRYGQSA